MAPRGRGEIIMTASGAFAQGPSQSEKVPIPRGRALGASVMRDWSAKVSGPSGSSSKKSTTTAKLVDSDPEDHLEETGDMPQDLHGRKLETVDLFDIGREGEMAPLVLPRDEKKWVEEEQLRKENERAMQKLHLKKRGRLDPAAASEATSKVKQDPYEEEEALQASLRNTPVSTGAGPGSRAQSVSSASVSVKAEPSGEMRFDGPTEDAAVLGAEDVKIKVKKEDISQYFHLPPEVAKTDRFYVFQFPRLFPQFYDPNIGPPEPSVEVKKEDPDGQEESKPNVAALLNSQSDPGADAFSAKHKVRSAYHESESEAWRDYEPGKWQGWGRNPGQDMRENLAGHGAEDLSGRIGKLKIRKSGKTTMKLGGIEYDVSPKSRLHRSCQR